MRGNFSSRSSRARRLAAFLLIAGAGALGWSGVALPTVGIHVSGPPLAAFNLRFANNNPASGDLRIAPTPPAMSAATAGAPTFAQPVMSGIGGTGFEQSI